MTITATPESTGWMADASTFGARLALIRQRMRWGNVAKAAQACGVPTDSWRNWETDGREPRRLTTIAKQISGAVGCDYLWLVHGPDRGEGGGAPTHEYSPVRVVTTYGDDRPTRPVHRTRPASRSLRPMSSAAA